MNSPKINNLKKCRRIAGYTQKDIALIFNFTYTTVISKWERGLSLPCTKHLFTLSILYNVSPNELYPTLWESLKEEAAEKKLLLPSKNKITEDHHFYL